MPFTERKATVCKIKKIRLSEGKAKKLLAFPSVSTFGEAKDTIKTCFFRYRQ